VRSTLVDQGDRLIDFPRGVGIDDETLRTFQTGPDLAGAAAHPAAHHAHGQRQRPGAGRGRPAGQDYSWSRRNAFIQPLVDRELLAGLARYPHVDVHFGQRAVGYTDGPHGVRVTVERADGSRRVVHARYLVGCDGGRSATRRAMGVTFEGATSPTRWLVIDVRNDPLGTPNAYLGADPQRPFVSIGLPHGIRRFEFMLFDHETDEQVAEPAFVHAMLAKHVPDPTTLDFIRRRVYTTTRASPAPSAPATC
jgi:3-(3-hydroxy-phenyl)propionate hydroxylase